MQPRSCANSIRLGCGAACHDHCFSLVLPELAPGARRPCTVRRAHFSFIQEGKLPLHYAAAKSAPSEVMKLLLNANREATTSRDKASPHCMRRLRVCFRRVLKHPPRHSRPLPLTTSVTDPGTCL